MLTNEQQRIIDEVCNSKDNRIIAVNAVAGSGKTFTCRVIIDSFKPRNGFYTTFNKGILEDSKNKLKEYNVECRTIHSLAYKYIKPSLSIKELTYNTIKENIGYYQKSELIKTIDHFFRSKYVDLDEYIDKVGIEEDIVKYLVKYITAIDKGVINPTFNYLLKKLHVLLYHGIISIDKDLVILDEAQDTTEVTLEIFKLINSYRKVVLGDKHQNIYSFLDTVNAFELLKDIKNFSLTKSFRCNEEVASIVEKYGRKYLNIDFMFKGNDNVKYDDTYAYISRTNSQLILRMIDLIGANKYFKTLRPINEIFELPEVMYDIINGRDVFNYKYQYLIKEYKEYNEYKKMRYSDLTFAEYLKFKLPNEDPCHSAISMLNKINSRGINIHDLRKIILDRKVNDNIILSTAHTFKGLEATKVYIENDLNDCLNNIKKDNYKDYTKEDKEETNTYYVALSRAKKELSNYNY